MDIDHNFKLEYSGSLEDERFAIEYGNIKIITTLGKSQTESPDTVNNHLQIFITNFPYIIELVPNVKYATSVAFRITLPRSYPSNIHLTTVSFDMIPYHPNINPITGKFGNFMFSVELDGIMWDILQMLLYEPEHILPRDNATDAIDFALNKDAMNWYLNQDKEKLYLEHKINFKESLLLLLRQT